MACMALLLAPLLLCIIPFTQHLLSTYKAAALLLMQAMAPQACMYCLLLGIYVTALNKTTHLRRLLALPAAW